MGMLRKSTRSSRASGRFARMKSWCANRARELVTRIFGEPGAMEAGAATQCQPSSQNIRTVRITRE
jgi:hypothetical protein